MDLKIAHSKQGCTVLVWIFEKGERPTSPITDVSTDLYNRFVMAGTPLDFLRTIESLGPLYSPGSGVPTTIADEARTVQDIRNAWCEKPTEGAFSPCIPELLQAETVFHHAERHRVDGEIDPKTDDAESRLTDEERFAHLMNELNTRLNKSALRRAVEQYSLNNEVLAAMADDTEVLIESYQDWILVRNSLVYGSQLYAASMDTEAGDSRFTQNVNYYYLDETGRSDDCVIEQCLACLAAPCDYTAYETRSLESLPSHRTGPLNRIPLMNLLVDSDHTADCRASYRTYGSAVSKPSFLLRIFEGPLPKELVKSNDAGTVKQYYLFAMHEDKERRSDREIAAEAFSLLQERLFRGPAGRWADILGGIVPEGPAESNGGSRLGVDSLIAALWRRMVFHPGMVLTTCAHCGNTVLTSGRGQKSRFCSSACRVAEHRESHMN